MSIRQICKCHVVQVSKNALIEEAAKLMENHNVGSLVVIEENKPCGMITDRDIVTKVVANELDVKKILVGDILTKELLILKDNQGIHEVIDMMCAKGVRRAPIIDESNEIVGIATVDDLLITLTEEMNSLARLIRKQVSTRK